MVKTLKGLPVSMILTVVSWVALSTIPGCAGCKVKLTCGGASVSSGGDDKREGVAAAASLTGTARVVTSTFEGVSVGSRCKLVMSKTEDEELGEARVSCFAGTNTDGGLLVYEGKAPIEVELRDDGESDDRYLWIDESADVRARIEYDGKRDMPGTIRIWSVASKWVIEAEAPKAGA